MTDQFAWGVATILLGSIGLGLLAATGSVQTLLSPTLQRRPVTAIAIGGCVLLLVSGVVTVVRARRPE